MCHQRHVPPASAIQPPGAAEEKQTMCLLTQGGERGNLAPLNTKAKWQVIFRDVCILRDELFQKCLHLVGEEILRVRTS